ncbi:MAG: hypothetical protein P8I27_12615 [Pirellulaceae bacterium]|nr:hypothetical protein [Pirellulaceae bacterium]
MWRVLTILTVFLLFAAITQIPTLGQTPGLAPGQQVVVEGITRQISTIEWLAPLAPVALSPFFGITLLSGLACYGPDWLPDNVLLSSQSPLANPTLFWTFLMLTVLTSVPRFSKVSKPIAQFTDFLETYSAIIVLVGLKLITNLAPAVETESSVMVNAGLFSMSYDVLIAIAMAVNVIVINAVKFFFELLVWVTPVPALDACFEIANKSICVGLMAIYVFSPLTAMILNIVIFLACLFIFNWVRRRELFFRTVVLDYVLGKINPRRGQPIPERLVVFPAFHVGSIKRRSRCHLVKTENGLELTCRRWLRSPLRENLTGKVVVEKDYWTNSINLPSGEKLTFSNRYNDSLPQLAEQFGGTFSDLTPPPADLKLARQVEFR